ncbi:rab-3A-interacting protein isoform X1 [Takifugu flavidus]|uniref:Rab-3A-interacting protein n=1 Tax=Takifugu flavidus TaxID=433684 RepID=A0A5C6NEE4_9TELE|nr:rab-3A-interacting protein isoform X1 [Takifugu flavidus]XP_056877946.1 rab-3A-interacting protein isoform X1 [Takifugu flavidus]TWW64901.1 Rab-3A-interacting protein [Takifugu flavidus]
MACSGGQSNAETLEGFHEVNLASPTTPDLQNQAEQRPAARHCAPPTSLYRTHSLGGRTSLCADQLPTQPVYSTPRPSHNGSVSGQEAESADGNLLSGEDGEECGALSESLSRLRSPSVMEVREKGYERLKEELAKAQRELLLKDEECERLSKVRDQLGQELEELTASLFQEAHKMVHEANIKQANAEKQLKEALGKIDVLQAEVQALKTLVLSSPTSPVGELPSVGGGGVKTPFRKGHSRNKSTSSAILGTQPDPSATQPIVRECREVDNQLFSDFKAWKEEPTLDRSCCFLQRVYREDIYPCLTFSKSELGSAILEAVEHNALSVEPVGFQTLPVVKASAVECGGPKKCALSGQTKTCKHRIKFGDSSNYYYISPYCRYRITTVCNFFTYIRYIQQGLVKQQDAEQMFWEVMQLRREMSLAKLGYYKDQL